MKDLPAAMRPREKLLSLGPASLADAELLALLLRTGLRGQGVLQMAENLLQQLGGLGGLLTSSGRQLQGIKGLGPAKRAELLAVMELARRGLTYAQIADRVGVSTATIGRIACGQRRQDLYQRIQQVRASLEPRQRRKLRGVSANPRGRSDPAPRAISSIRRSSS